jgi:hypothetical protein
MHNNLAPVALFVFKRVHHTKKTIESLLQNSEAKDTELYIYSDSWVNQKDRLAVESVRTYIKEIVGFKSIKIILRTHNFGLSKSIINGVEDVLSGSSKVIVLEDDMLVSKYFLNYMNNALINFEHNERVISIHGYTYPTKYNLGEAFFLRGADCWGWATWRRGWALFNTDGQVLLDELKRCNLIKAFDFNGAYGYSEMLKSQIKGSNDSWAIRWYASAFLADKLTLYPGRSLVHNIGNDSSGTHCGISAVHDTALSITPINLAEVEVIHSKLGFLAFENFFQKSKTNLVLKVGYHFKHALKKLFA